eukprot:PITA_01430
MDVEEYIASYFIRVAEVVNSLNGLDENIEESTIVQKVLRSLPDRFDSKISAIEEIKDLDTLNMDELHGILTAYEMRKGGPRSKDATFKASKSKKGKERNVSSDESDVESELAQFVRKKKKGSKLKGKYPLIYFKCGKIGHYAAKCPHRHDSDDEGNSKRMVYKKKGINKKNLFSKKDESDEDEFIVIREKLDEESDHAESQETLFMAFTNDDDSGLEGNVDELSIRAIEENEKLQNKIIYLKVEIEETKRREYLLETKLKEKEETCEECEAKIVFMRKELEQVKKGWKSSQIFETILKSQKPQHDKFGIGFKGKSSSTKNSAKSYVDALSNNPKEERVFHQRHIPDPKNKERITPKKNVDSNHGNYNKYKPVFHQRPISNPKNEAGVIPRKNVDSNRGCYNSGCSRHMIWDKRKFVLLSKKEGNVSFGSGSARIARKGTVTLINGKGKAQNSLLVNGLKHNLLSVSQICDQGHNVVFSTKDCEIRNSSSRELVLKGVRTLDNIYILNNIQEDKCCLSQTDEIWLWHKRIGHISFENLINISKIKAVRDIPKLFKQNQGICGPCQHGKKPE